MVRQPGYHRELVQLLAQRGPGRVHGGPVLGQPSKAATPRTTSISTSIVVSWPPNPGDSVPLASFNSNNVYTKGALVMQMLKKHLGPGAVLGVDQPVSDPACPRQCHQRRSPPRGPPCHRPESRLVLGSVDLPGGLPRFSVTSAYDSAPASLTLTVRQTQVDTARADSAGVRFVTPLVFQGPVTIRVGTSAGDVRKRVRLDRREQVIRSRGCKSRPNMVVFDENNAMLKTLTFEQPTRWLANQLSRDPDLWNRNWVIEPAGANADRRLAGGRGTRPGR